MMYYSVTFTLSLLVFDLPLASVTIILNTCPSEDVVAPIGDMNSKKLPTGNAYSLSSVVGVIGNAGQVNYAASKAGVIGMTMSLARELGPRGVTVNAVAPGFIETDMTEVLSDEIKVGLKASIPLGTLGHVEDVAKTIAFLASDDAKYITGQTIHVDGGMAM